MIKTSYYENRTEVPWVCDALQSPFMAVGGGLSVLLPWDVTKFLGMILLSRKVVLFKSFLYEQFPLKESVEIPNTEEFRDLPFCSSTGR